MPSKRAKQRSEEPLRWVRRRAVKEAEGEVKNESGREVEGMVQHFVQRQS